MYFPKMTVWISQCLLLEMRSSLAGWMMRFAHLKRKLQCGLQNWLTALGASTEGVLIQEWGASRPLSHEAGAPHGWLLLHI